VWSSPVALSARVFCNRSLNMKSVAAVGFDMDYTLAQYRPETFETLAYTQALGKLVSDLHYPADVLSFVYDPHYMMRGLAVDKSRGNVLKMDRHKYVKLAFHGFQELSREERLATYADAPGRESFDEPDYALLDTLFSLGETYLFCQLVELKDAQPQLLAHKTYAQMHAEVRQAVDMCHRDGSLKRVVAADPAQYIYPDASLVPLLQMLKASGRKTFLVTNSLWDYTHVVMNFLCCGCVGDAKTLEWTRHFDVVITGSSKPRFFEDERAPIFAVDPRNGSLLNTDNGAPLPAVGGSDPLAVRPGLQLTEPHVLPIGAQQQPQPQPQPHKLFQGGCYRHLHAMLHVASGSQVLYVGDHIYGDILRSKKTLGWRTCLVVPELAAELRVRGAQEGRQASDEFRALRARRDAIDDELQRLEWALRGGCVRAQAAAAAHLQPGGAQGVAAVEAALSARAGSLRAERDALRERHRGRLREYHESFHGVWGAPCLRDASTCCANTHHRHQTGMLMKTGYANSRFASQVERFACLYTSHVGNLLAYSPEKSYRSAEDRLPHEESRSSL